MRVESPQEKKSASSSAGTAFTSSVLVVQVGLSFFLNEYVQLRKQPRIPLDSRPVTCLDPMNQPSFSRYEADPELPEIEEEEEAIL